MASISAAISLFVLLLATYCNSIPIGTEFEHSTIGSTIITDKVIVERDELPFTFAETTVDPRIQVKRTGNVGHESAESAESREHTTERSISTEDKKTKRTMFEETTLSTVERSVDGVEFEETTIIPEHHMKRTNVVHPVEDNESNEYTTERSLPIGHEHQKRTIFDETTLSMIKRGDGDVDEESEVDDSNKDGQKRESQPVIFDETTSDVVAGESKAERNVDLELVNKVETSSEFNSHASRFMESESDVSAFTEPTSSFESLAHSTGLLKTRTVPETVEPKIEGTLEEIYTTFKPDY